MAGNTYKKQREQSWAIPQLNLPGLGSMINLPKITLKEGLSFRMLSYLLWIMFLITMYIGIKHDANRTALEIKTLDRDVKDLRVDYTTLQADYLYYSKQTEIQKRVHSLGLIESKNAPIKLKNGKKD